MKIAIVDDLQTDRALLKSKLVEFGKRNHLDFEITTFDSGESFLQSFKPTMFEIVFLDIYMKKLTGIEVAKQIFAVDQQCKLIFLTTSDEFFRQSYSVHAVYYLLKPIVDTEFEQAMEFCNIVPRYTVPIIDIKTDGVTSKLNTELIYYVDICLRKTNIHLRDRVVETTIGFSVVENILKEDSRFVISARGVLVNVQHITDIADDSFIMDNNEAVPISKRNKKDMQQLWIDYNFKKLGEDLWI